jgi:hypothetical protein
VHLSVFCSPLYILIVTCTSLSHMRETYPSESPGFNGSEGPTSVFQCDFRLPCILSDLLHIDLKVRFTLSRSSHSLLRPFALSKFPLQRPAVQVIFDFQSLTSCTHQCPYLFGQPPPIYLLSDTLNSQHTYSLNHSNRPTIVATLLVRLSTSS